MTSERTAVSRAVAWVSFASSAIAALDGLALWVLVGFLVTTADLGVATYAVTLFYFLDLVTDAGLSSVLIQGETIDAETESSLFWLNSLITALLFVAMLFIGPLIGRFQGHPIVGTMLIVYATKLLYQNVYFVPAALLRRELRFKELSIVRTVANLGDVAGRLGFAIAGEPIWCFVAGPLIRVFITGVGLQICRPWRPRFHFQTRQVRAWLTYGVKTTSSQALQHLYNNIGYQIVGHFFGETALGTFRLAYEVVLYPVNFVTSIVTTVSFPAFARVRNDAVALVAQFRRFSRQNLAVILPILVAVIVAADDIFAVLFPRVRGAAQVTRILCVVGLFRAVDCLYLPLLDAVGMAGRNVQVAIVATIVLTGCDIGFSIALGPQLGILAVAIGRVVGYPLVIGIHAYFALGQIQLSLRTYLSDFTGIVLCGLLALIPGFLVEFVGLRMLPGLPVGMRLVAATAASLLAIVILLDRLQGLGLRRILKEFKR